MLHQYLSLSGDVHGKECIVFVLSDALLGNAGTDYPLLNIFFGLVFIQ